MTHEPPASRRSPRSTTTRRLLGLWLVAVGLLAIGGATPVDTPPALQTIAPTMHLPLPRTAAEAWMVPAPDAAVPSVYHEFANGLRRLSEGAYGQALLAVSDARLTSTPLAAYGSYFTSIAYLRLSRPTEARSLLDTLRGQTPQGYLAEAIALAQAEAAEAVGDLPAAERYYDELSKKSTATPDVVLERLARTATAVGDRVRAEGAWLKLYAEYPLSDATAAAETAVEAMRQGADEARRGEIAAFEIQRGEKLFAAKRWTDARPTFAAAASDGKDDSRELVELRIAECDYYLGRHRAAIDRLTPFLDGASRSAEARFFHASALRALGSADYVPRVRQLLAQYPATTWAEDARNALATYYILDNDDEAAAGVFAEMLDQHPEGRHFERAAWKLGWWRYKNGDLDEAIRVFERAAATRPRADWRPAWLYWAARARERQNQADMAASRYEVVVADYMNSYYGRLAAERLKTMGKPAPVTEAPEAPAADALRAAPLPDGASNRPALPTPPPNQEIVRTLIGAELYDLAIQELQYAQRTWGSSPVIEATLAWIYSQQGDLRRGINVMKRAYPQYIAAGGESLPEALLDVLFPIDHWDTVRRYATRHDLDPYVVAALIAQESTFEPGARSAANAWGLMQILPSTGRRLARAEGLRRFSVGMLTDPETNIRLGTRYFAGLVRQFGGAHFALASYNAGESRIVRWRSERPGLERDEFIDDIPFPETQNYVKRILGTAEDYRRLYGPERKTPVKTRARVANSALGASRATKVVADTPTPTKAKVTRGTPAKKKAPSRASSRRRPGR